MKQKKSAPWMHGLILLALGVGLASCKTLRSNSATLEVRIVDGKVEITGDVGKCAKLTFVDSDGENIECDVHELPSDPICPPPGAQGATGEYVPCPSGGAGSTDPDSYDPSESILNGHAGLGHFDTYRFFGFPLEIDPGEGYVEYELEIRAKSRHRARLIRDRILEQAHSGLTGFQERIPGVYVIHHLIHAQLVGRNVLFTLFDTKAFEQFDLTVNDMAGYRDIDDVFLVQRHGWHMAGVAVGLADLDWGFLPGVEYGNSYELAVKNVGSNPEELAGEWVYTP